MILLLLSVLNKSVTAFNRSSHSYLEFLKTCTEEGKRNQVKLVPIHKDRNVIKTSQQIFPLHF